MFFLVLLQGVAICKALRDGHDDDDQVEQVWSSVRSVEMVIAATSNGGVVDFN